ncbi:MAG: Helicase associated domain protein [Acidimicrobiales bacterium]
MAQSGRTFEAFGEDPFLTSVMGVADAEGIQSGDVMADAKHFTAYNQETDRQSLKEVVPQRALQELYDRPFAAVITEAHVASVMCSYGVLNGVNDCSDPSLYRLLRSWGFTGFVRSDLAAVDNPAAAFQAGLDLIKLSRAAWTKVMMTRAVDADSITRGTLDEAIMRVLTKMFAFGLIATHGPSTSPHRLEGFRHLKDFVTREGHAMVSVAYIEVDGYHLGQWTAVQRRRHAERARRLETLPGWNWDMVAAKQQTAMEHLRHFVAREGHARIPVLHIEDGFALGGWASERRKAYRRGKLDETRVNELEGFPGWRW